jgi:hypothetical protein
MVRSTFKPFLCFKTLLLYLNILTLILYLIYKYLTNFIKALIILKFFLFLK